MIQQTRETLQHTPPSVHTHTHTNNNNHQRFSSPTKHLLAATKNFKAASKNFGGAAEMGGGKVYLSSLSLLCSLSGL
eukprot:2239196-Rhodomonas_salina.1